MATQALMNSIVAQTQSGGGEKKVAQLLNMLVALELGYDRLYRRGSVMDEKGMHAKAAAYQAAGFPSGTNSEGDPTAGTSSAMLQEALAVFKEQGDDEQGDGERAARQGDAELAAELLDDADGRGSEDASAYAHDEEGKDEL